MLFFAVQSIFATLAADHALAGTIATNVFHVANRLQLGLAAFGLAVEAVRRAAFARRSAATPLLWFSLATAAALFVSLWVAPQIDRLRLAGQTQTPQFKQLHGISMSIYLAEVICLAIVCVVTPLFHRSRTLRLSR